MRRLIRFLLPLLVIGGALAIAQYLLLNPPQAKPRPREVAPRSIEAMPLALADFPIRVRSYGELRARTEGDLVAQVDGLVTEVAAAFRSGGRFASGDLLLQLDARDYEIELQIAEAALVQADAALREERARSEEAARDWKRLGRKGEPSALASRQPQLQAAQAAVRSARAQRDRARLQLARTRITAPYDGRVLERLVSPGQYVGRGARLARIYASDVFEVRLPLNSRQLARLDLPPGEIPAGAGPRALLTAEPGGQQWQARIVRSEAAIDSATGQLHLVAELPLPEDARIGQFVRAEIDAGTLRDVFVVPRSALRQAAPVAAVKAAISDVAQGAPHSAAAGAGDGRGSGSELLVVRAGKLRAQPVTVLWGDAQYAVIDPASSGLAEGELVNLSPLGSVQPGLPVEARLVGVADAGADQTATDQAATEEAATEEGGTDGGTANDSGAGESTAAQGEG